MTLYSDLTTAELAKYRTPAPDRTTNPFAYEDPKFACPVCECRKNGQADFPNAVEPQCTDGGCDCHADDWADEPACEFCGSTEPPLEVYDNYFCANCGL